jgi:predicted nuclease with TOPRIM domain
VALIASANRVVQDPGSVGAALRTISLRLRGTSTRELEEAGEDTTGVVESKSKLRRKIQGYTGVDILTDTGAYKSTYEILLEISKVWDDLTDTDQAGLLELIAGKTRSNTAAAILSNGEDLKDALLAAQEAEGSALAENEKYLDSIQGKLDQFNNAVQTMWEGALDDDVVKFFVDIGTQLVKWVDNLGLIKTLVMAIGTFLIQKNFKGDLFGGLFNVPTNIKEVKAQLQSLRTEYEKAQQAYDTNHTDANKRYLDKTKKTYEKYDSKVSPQIKEYDKLTEKLNGLQEKRQSLADDLANSQAHEDFLGKRMAAGYEDAAGAIDKAHTNTEKLKGQIGQVDQEIVNTEIALKNVEVQVQNTGIAGATAGQKFKAGFKSAAKSVGQFAKQVATSMLTMYAITTVLELLGKFGNWIEDVIDGIHDTPEELQEKFEELNNELSKTKTEIRSLEGELETTNDRIEELMDIGTLTFIEQEEISKLKATTAELERQISLKETLQKSQQQGVNAASINATDAYLDTSFMSDKTRTERQEEAKETGKTIATCSATYMNNAS